MKIVFVFASAFMIIWGVAVCPANAQNLPVGTSIDLELSMNNPAPGQEISITARSYNTDIKSASLTWTVDGKTVLKGIGETVLTVKAPAQGKRMTVNVTAQALDGIVHRGSVVVTSGSIDLILENDGYVPPFFRGKVPVSYQNTVRIVAIPHVSNTSGTEYDPKTLVYEWKRNGKILESASGYGKQALTLEGDIIPRPFSVTVSVAPRQRSTESLGMTNVDFFPPSVSVYFDDPLYGPLFNKEISNAVRIGSEKEVGVIAVPYGFNKPEKGMGDLVLKWFINGLENAGLADNLSLVLRAPSGASGASDINLDIRNSEKILQGARTGFSAVFSAQKEGSSIETPAF